MTEATGYVAGPYQGVSQAPPQVRLQGACEAMEDCLAAIPNGVQKRPPFEYKGQIKKHGGSSFVVDAYAMWFDLPLPPDGGTDYAVLIHREPVSLAAYLVDTTSWATIADVTISAGARTYLETSLTRPCADLRACTVEDTTFITNRNVKTALDPATIAARPYEALLWCKTHGYARVTTVTVTSTALSAIGGSYTAQFTSGAGSGANDPKTVGTDKLAKALYNGTDPFPGADTPNTNPLTTLQTTYGFTVTWSGSVIYISHPTIDFSITVSDDFGGQGVVPIKGSVQRFSDLPALAASGFTVQIKNSAIGGDSDYFVEFVPGSTAIAGTWREVIQPGAAKGLDVTKMPVGLVYEGGTWQIKALPWKQRLVGNATLSPDPEFIGQAIQDIGWWNGRLALTSHGQVNLSASDDPYKFYTTTLAAALDSDPIGLLQPVANKTALKESVTFDQRLVALGDLGQAVISTTGVTAAGTVKMEELSNAQFTDAVRTQKAIHKVYFAAAHGDYLSVSELAIDRISGLAIPNPQSAAVPRYLTSNVDRAATVEDEFLTFYGISGSTRIVVHAFRHDENERVQNAWFAWNLPTGWGCAGLFTRGTTLYALLKDPAGLPRAATMDLSPLTVDPNGTIMTYGDIRIAETALAAPTYDAVNNRTTFTLPFAITSAFAASVRAPVVNPSYPEGYLPAVVSRTSNTIVLAGDWRTIHLYFGFKYASYFDLSQFYKRGADGMVERSGRLVIKRVKVDLARFSYIRAEVEVNGRDTRLIEYNGYNANDPTTPLDTPANQKTVVFSFPVGGKSDDVHIRLVNDTFLGFALLGYEWEGDWTPKARRVT